MSLLDDVHKELSKRHSVEEKRRQIEALRKKAKDAFNAQFLMDAAKSDQIAFLKGRIAAFEECLALFDTEVEKRPRHEKKRRDDDDF